MSRTLLFVQTGDGRPKCVLRSVPEHMARRGGEWLREQFHEKALGAVRLAWMYGQWMKAFKAADRWWLVECETADEGRWTLLKAGFVRGPLFPTKFREGRILAQGGRS